MSRMPGPARVQGVVRGSDRACRGAAGNVCGSKVVRAHVIKGA